MSAKTNIEKLPESCYSVYLVTGEVIVIKAGEKGYYKVGQPNDNLLGLCDLSSMGIGEPITKEDRKEAIEKFVDGLNAEKGITKGHRMAMDFGSCFGWEVPAADADTYDSEGNYIRIAESAKE